MALNSRGRPSGVVLSVVTGALNVAAAATDAIPIANHILSSAAHISAAAEKIQKKRQAVYLLGEKAAMYATQIDQAIAGCVIDDSLNRRLSRFLSVFVKIEALFESNLGRKNRRAKVWHKFITVPNQAEELAAELDQEMVLFNILTGIQLSLTVARTAHMIAQDPQYNDEVIIKGTQATNPPQCNDDTHRRYNPQYRDQGQQTEDESQIQNGDATNEGTGEDDEHDGTVEEDEAYETAEEGEGWL